MDEALAKIKQAQKALAEAESLLSSSPSGPSSSSASQGLPSEALTKEGRGEAAPPSGGRNPTGAFDGQFMVTVEGKKYQVPPNYASKSRLVVGDSLELVREATGDTEGDQNFVKLIKKVARIEKEGILTKKEFQWAAVTDEGTYWVLPASVEFYNGEIGDRVKLLLPEDYRERGEVEWAAVDEVRKDTRADSNGSNRGESRRGEVSLPAAEGGLSGEIVLEQQPQKNQPPSEPRPQLAREVEELR